MCLLFFVRIFLGRMSSHVDILCSTSSYVDSGQNRWSNSLFSTKQPLCGEGALEVFCVWGWGGNLVCDHGEYCSLGAVLSYGPGRWQIANVITLTTL